MSSTGNVFPGTGANDAGIGATAWTSPGNITATDANDATCNAGASSQYLVAKNFGFSIPAGSGINGITVRVNASESSAGSETLFAQLQNDSGTLVGSSKSNSVNGTSKTVYTYGTTADTWGAALNTTIVNDVDFGVRIWFTTSHNVAIDYVTLAVEYTAGTAALASGSTLITSARGTLLAVPTSPLVGQASATATGTVTFSGSDVPLVGSASTVGQGTITRGRGQQIDSAQGSVGTAQPLVGTASTVGQGTIAPDANPPVEEDVFGEEVAVAQGASTQTLFIGLKSKKVGAPSSATWALVGSASSSATGLFTPSPSRTPTGQLITMSQGQHGKQRTAALLGSSSAVASGTVAAPSVGVTSTTLSLQAGTAGTYPYSATFYPIAGDVAAGLTVRSSDDTTLRASILSTHADGSAAVVVLAGTMTFTTNQLRTITLSSTGGGDSPLAPSAISALVSSVSVAFSGALGTVSITDFSTPEKTWWANGQVICARYRVNVSGGLCIVADIHAYAAGRAFVEVMVENSLTNCSAATVLMPASTASYTATVSVNGSTVAAVSTLSAGGAIPNSRIGSTFTNAGHESLRAWYASTWVGGDPGLDITHDPAYLQRHPWFWQQAVASTETLSTKYAQTYDTYVPWATCRLRLPGMAGGGDDEQIALFPEDQADYFLTGSKYARRAVIQTGLACATADFHVRHTDGSLPLPSQIAGKGVANGLWPGLPDTAYPVWGGETTHDGSHVPAVGLVPFLCRPSPVFIETAQKEANWNATNYWRSDAAAGAHPFDQPRARAWRMRNYGIAIFLTPDSDATRKADMRTWLANEIAVCRSFFDISWNLVKVFYGATTDSISDGLSGWAGIQESVFMQNFCAVSWHALDKAQVLRGSAGTAMTTLADDGCYFPLKMINDSTSYEWRALPYSTTVGTLSGSTINMTDGNVATKLKAERGGIPYSAPGAWRYFDFDDGLSGHFFGFDNAYAQLLANVGSNYVAVQWNAYCAAKERGIADAAWAKIIAGIDGLSVWKTGFSTLARWNRSPRNYTPAALPASTPAAGKFADASTNLPSAADPCPLNNCVYSNASGFSTVWDSWNGGAFAPTLGTYGSLLMFGGGHASYDGNAVIAYDVAARTFSRLNEPALYAEANANSNGAYPDGSPYPNHVNMGCDYLPPEAGGGTLGSYVFISHAQSGTTIVNNNLYRFDLSLRTWSRWLLPQTLGTFIAMAYDSYRKGLWVVASPDTTSMVSPHPRQLYFLNVATQTQTAVSVGSPGGLMTSALYIPSFEYVRNRDCLVYPISSAGHTVNCIDLNGVVPGTTSFVTEFSIVQSGTKCPSLWSFPSGTGAPSGDEYLYHAACERFAYCSEDGGLYALNMIASGSADIYRLDVPPTLNGGTWTWTHETLATTGGAALALRVNTESTVRDIHMYGRFRYVPGVKSFVFSDGIRTAPSPSFAKTPLPAQLLRPAAFT